MQWRRTFNGQYQVCPRCWRCVDQGKRFKTIPTMSWANGCWVGEQPDELKGLTYAEELVIARAHSTKCWVKLKARSDPRHWQRGASGNVCIFPHEMTNIAKSLPRPIAHLHDEVAVIIV
ncbi:hypothetical protein CYLTODRAFT_363788, partial [Cylindrobasidium torrendii FP15055 ss-10]